LHYAQQYHATLTIKYFNGIFKPFFLHADDSHEYKSRKMEFPGALLWFEASLTFGSKNDNQINAMIGNEEQIV